ncbi:TonB-dependent receptor domain-containing protein [Novosphingobium sp. 9]|uniref:TonB-dependent receptor domain-containing protein n=1 Tax=Novosphingobium sp. 9 TaxID=2025349 RepID=UPI0021B6CFCA|nr:TonB-dependent receptor [Novosphingobium sp. 9]
MQALFRRLAIGSAMSVIAMATPALAHAATFNVPSQDVASAVRVFARQANVQIMVSGQAAQGRRTQAISGAMNVDQALRRMLANTGLSARLTGAGTYVVVADSKSTDARPAHVSSADASAEEDASTPAAPAEIVVLGSGQARSVSTLLPSNLAILPPGSSLQKSLNFLPGVMAQSIDALGLNEQSMSLQVRGFSTTHLGYTLDGMPLGDGSYNNYNGLSISRALISENLGSADLATGIAGLGIASTSNLGGAITYVSSDPKKDLGLDFSQTVGSEKAARTYIRFDTGEHGGFSAYISGQYARQNLFVDQADWSTSTEKQLNAKAKYEFDGGSITAFGDISRTNQADDPYLSKDMISRLGWDWGGYAPDWNSYLGVAACTVKTTPTACVAAPSPQKNSDVTYTNGQILRNDELFYVSGDYAFTKALSAHLQVYHHEDKGDGNNWIAGLSTQGTTTTADDVPVQIRDTRYTINRSGVLGHVDWDVAFNHFEAGFWMENNKSSAARYIWANVTGPFDIGQFLDGTPTSAQWVQGTTWRTRQFYAQDTVSLFDDALNIDFGFKSSYSRSSAHAEDGIAATPPPASTQFASGTLIAKDNFLPQVGVHWKVAQGHELYASYSENMAMYQGGFKLGPQSVTQSVWDAQGSTLKPETSKSVEGGYRYVSRSLQVSLAGYWVKFDNRLLQYNPCPTNQQQNPGCGNSFHNAGSVTSRGVELGVLWKPRSWVSWYNSASLNKTTYDQDLNWCTTTCTIYDTKGKQQVDTPKTMISSVLTLQGGGFSASLQGKYTGRRYYTYTNDQSFGGYTTLDMGVSYDFGDVGVVKHAKLGFNVTNLTDKRYVANFDNSVFAPSDATGTVLVAHSSAPRQFFGTFSAGF